MTDTLRIWDAFEKTDPRYTKTFSGRGGFEGTAINATYILKRLTEAFGPCGVGWRFVLEDEKIVDGHLLKNGLDRAKLHIVRGHLDYIHGGIWYSTSPQFGQTMLVSENKYGPLTDEDAPKKSITDCISKCAVLLGIGADIHLGLYDDNRYVAALREEMGAPDPAVAPKTEAKDAKVRAPAADAAKTFADGCIVALKAGFPDIETFDAWHKPKLAQLAKLRSYEPALHKDIVAMIDATLERLNPVGR